MGTTYVVFVPSQTANFQFQATFDGATYTVTTFWLLPAMRYYITITGGDGTVIVTEPLIASPDGYNINLLGGYFFSTQMVFRESSQTFEIAPLGTVPSVSQLTPQPLPPPPPPPITIVTDPSGNVITDPSGNVFY